MRHSGSASPIRSNNSNERGEVVLTWCGNTPQTIVAEVDRLHVIAYSGQGVFVDRADVVVRKVEVIKLQKNVIFKKGEKSNTLLSFRLKARKQP